MGQHQACEVDVPQAEARLNAAMAQLQKDQEELRIVMVELSEAETKVFTAQSNKTAAQNALDHYLNVVWEAYQWLVSDKNPGDYDRNASYIDAKIDMLYP